MKVHRTVGIPTVIFLATLERVLAQRSPLEWIAPALLANRTASSGLYVYMNIWSLV